MTSKKTWLKLFKLSISITCLFYISFIFWKNTAKLSSLSLSDLFSSPLWVLPILLMPINWILEAKKWHVLISPLQSLSKNKTAMAILSGLTIALFTPNRIGEFGGRIMFLHKQNRIPGTISTWIGSIIQLCITIIMGVFGVFYLISTNIDFQTFYSKQYILIIVAFILLVLIILIIAFNKSFLNRLKKSNHRLLAHFSYLKTFKTSQLLLVIGLSLSRYFVFSCQFLILCRILNVNLSTFEILAGISSVFLISSIIPSIALIEFGIRGSVAIFIFSFFGIDTIPILTATILLWLINIATPALMGALAISKIRI